MFFIFIAISLSHETPPYHFCNHDVIQKKTKVRTISFPNSKLKLRLAKEREPIRIHLDFRIDKDQFQCVEVGQQVSWQGYSYICEDIDIPNETQKISLKQTMENVQIYLQSILLVDRLDSPIDITSSLDDHFVLTDAPSTVENTDIFLSVFIRTYGDSQTLASAHFITVDEDTHRPIQGSVYANARYLPSESQNENTTNTNFFYTVIHEIMHALGISSDAFPYYHPKESNTPYEKPLVELEDKDTGKKHTFLVTPYSHKFAVMQWGVENFTINEITVPSGIEIEDGGGEGTAGSHPECRIGNQDLMVGVSLQGDVGPYNRFTPLTAAMLLDTGNYDIVWNKIQPLVWGNKESIDGNYIKDFVIGSPANVFPQQYIYRPSVDPYYDSCGFTFKMVGGLNKINITQQPLFNCSLSGWQDYANTKAYCDAEKFYNPNGDDEIGGNWPFDFQIVHFPTQEICGVGSACIAGMWNCAPYKIAEDGKSFTIVIDDVEFECNENNVNKIIKVVGEYTYESGFKCPPIEQFIRTVKMMEEQQYLTGDPFNEETQDASSSVPESTFEAPVSSDEDSATVSSEEDNESNSYDDTNSAASSDEDNTLESTGDENSIISSNEDHETISFSDGEDITDNSASNENDTLISSNDDEFSSSSEEEEHSTKSSEVDQTDVPPQDSRPNPSVDDSYQSSSSEITFTTNGFKDKDGNEQTVTNKDDISLIKSDQKQITLVSGNSKNDNLFVSPQNDNPIITIIIPEGQTDLASEIGLHANSKNPTVNLPKSSTPLNLFNNENSRITFHSEQKAESVPISLQKLTISDGTIHIDVPGETTGVEFKEVETYLDGKISTYKNNELAETSIGALKMHQGSNIEVENAAFTNSISCEAGSQMKIDGKAKFNPQTIINLTDTSFINFGNSLVEGICREIFILDSKLNAMKLDDNENSASVICGSNFDCESWKEKYTQNSQAYPYAKCTYEDGKGTCLAVTNVKEPTKTKKKGLSTGAIVGIVIACVVVVIIIIVAIVACRRRRGHYIREKP